jgi:hypothetical protein
MNDNKFAFPFLGNLLIQQLISTQWAPVLGQIWLTSLWTLLGSLKRSGAANDTRIFL